MTSYLQLLQINSPGLKTLKSLGFVTIKEDEFLANVRTGTCGLGDLGEVIIIKN